MTIWEVSPYGGISGSTASGISYDPSTSGMEVTNVQDAIDVIYGTGKDFKKISKQASILEGIGYDVSMLFVNTSLETALARNAKRKRTVDPELVEDMWLEVQNNLGAFQDFFGSNNFYIVDNSNDFDDPQAQAEFEKKLFKKGMQAFNAPLENYLGRVIIKKLRDSGGKYLSDLELIYSEEEIRKFKI
jgi:hypothetical protein